MRQWRITAFYRDYSDLPSNNAWLLLFFNFSMKKWILWAYFIIFYAIFSPSPDWLMHCQFLHLQTFVYWRHLHFYIVQSSYLKWILTGNSFLTFLRDFFFQSSPHLSVAFDLELFESLDESYVHNCIELLPGPNFSTHVFFFLTTLKCFPVCLCVRRWNFCLPSGFEISGLLIFSLKFKAASPTLASIALYS